MSDSKPWGTLEIDNEARRDFIEVTAATTVAEAADQLRGTPFARFAYLVLNRGGDMYAVIGWNELEHLTAGQSGVQGRTFGDLLASWPSVGAVTRGAVGIQKIRSDARAQPGERLVILDGGRVVALYATRVRGSDTLSSNDLLGGATTLPATDLPEPGVLSPGDASLPPSPEPSPSSEPHKERERQINALIEGGRGSSNQNPLAVGKRYVLRFNVDYADVVQKDSIGAGPGFKSDVVRTLARPEEIVVDMTFKLQGASKDIEILGQQDYTIKVPVEGGATGGESQGEALFLIVPKTLGTIVLLAFVWINGQLFQKVRLTLAVAEQEAINPPPQQARPLESEGFGIEQLGSLPQRANPLGLIITSRDSGYDLLLIGATTIRARLPLTEHAIAEIVEGSRKTMLDMLVHAKDAAGSKPYIRGWEVDEAFNQQTMEQLAVKGRALFNDLFYGPGAGADVQLIGNYIRQYSQEQRLNVEVVGQNFIFPWALIYDKPKNEPVTIDGFWGFKHVIQHLPEGGMPNFKALNPAIDAKNGVKMAFFFNENIDREMAGHDIIAGQRAFLQGMQGQGVTVAEHKTEGELVMLLDNADSDAHIIYLYCHAESFKPDETDRLNVKKLTSDSRLILTKDPGASVTWLREQTEPSFQIGGAPLVFINACQSAELSPFLYQGLVPFLIGKGVRGVLGTEVDTPALFAAEFAKRFFEKFLAGGQPLGQLLLDLRREFAEKHHNIVGLLYTLYSSGDVSLARK